MDKRASTIEVLEYVEKAKGNNGVMQYRVGVLIKEIILVLK